MSYVSELLELITNNSGTIKTENVREKTLKEYRKCSEEQAEIVVCIWKYLSSLYGKPVCVQHNGNRAEHIKGVEPFSLINEIIRFNVSDGICQYISIRLARDTTPGCKLRDPLLFYRYLDRNKSDRVLILNELAHVNDFLLLSVASSEEHSEFEIASKQSKRKAIDSCQVTFREKTELWPIFCENVKDDFNVVQEYRHEQGFVDAHMTSESKNVLVELKYINESENPLNKLRTAIGQILMYKNDSKRKFNDYSMWIVINESEIKEDVLKSLKRVSLSTGIEFYSVNQRGFTNLCAV